ncbi:phosphatase Dcr2p [Trichomonascus vanleenenianus]|uniref:metallophosphoesterase family protein n=1 Tax=Trichomonascus vanleenenianus TaxID=2268995 RepID=UPI003ECB740C
MPLHRPGSVVVDLKIVTCSTSWSCKDIESDGWTKIPKDLYLTGRWIKHGYLLGKRIDERDLEDDDKVVLDVAVGSSNNIPKDVIESLKKEKYINSAQDGGNDHVAVDMDVVEKAGWKRIDDSMLWVRYGKFNSRSSVTAVDVLFGPDAVEPRINWKLKENPLVSNSEDLPKITVRYGPKAENPSKVLKVPKHGKFKVLQVADLHFSTGYGKCVDPVGVDGESCHADRRTLEFLNKVLDKEAPDFVVLSGDQIYGHEAPDAETALLKVVAPFVKRKIPYAMIMGNHDDEGSLTRNEVVELASRLPYSHTSLGPEAIDGVGNYVLTVEGPQSHNPALTFYFLDSHKRFPDQKKNFGYDHIKDSQLKFVEQEYQRVKPMQEEYSHIPLSMAFIHIPLPEYRNSGNQIVGSFKEGSTAPVHNSGARDVFAKVGVSVVSVGHDHVNDFCMFDGEKDGHKENIWLCHAGGIGEGGYGGYGDFIRRTRIYDIDTQSATIKTYKYMHDEQMTKFDEQVLVSGGKPTIG